MDTEDFTLSICSREGTSEHRDNESISLMVSVADPELGTHGIVRPVKATHHLFFFHDLDDIECRAPEYVNLRKPEMRHIQKVVDLFYNADLNGKGALVHCECGVSRAPATAIIGLMALGFDPDAAYDIVHQMNPLSLPNRRILRFGADLFGNGKHLVDRATESRQYLFNLYSQSDPIAELERSLQSQHPTVIQAKCIIRYLSILASSCLDALTKGILWDAIRRFRSQNNINGSLPEPVITSPKNTFPPPKETLRAQFPTQPHC